MSVTVSRGRHTVRRWCAPSSAILDGLKENVPVSNGAFEAMAKFFSWTIAGIIINEGKPLDKNIRLTSALCALGIATKVSDASGQRCDDRSFKSRMKMYARLMGRKLRGVTRTEKKQLKEFLSALVEQA